MSIAVGIVFRDGIVVASDSKTTFQAHSRTNTLKISPVYFMHPGRENPERPGKMQSGLIAMAGDDAMASGVIRRIWSICQDQPFRGDTRQLAEAAEKATAEVYRELLLPYKDAVGFRVADCQQLAHENNFSLLIASYRSPNPQLHILDFPHGRVGSPSDDYAAIGGNKELALYLLKAFSRRYMTFGEAFATAAFVVNEVIKFDTTCEPPIQIMVLDERGQNHPVLPEGMAIAAEESDKLARILKDTYTASAKDSLKAIGVRCEVEKKRILG